MKFRPDTPIFQQIIERLEEQVLKKELMPEERVPAVRDYAAEMEVNPNTIVRSFLELEEAGVIFKKRGLGYFVSADGPQKVLTRRRKQFLDRELPDTVRKMQLLGITVEEFGSIAKAIINKTKISRFERKSS